ncbi:MAG: hypothetical protein JST89_01690 [Cyanobacteria bacterium SZAS-4]|nr:hypothetical protein [Cyanobacteria bacterium SZAS-4]
MISNKNLTVQNILVAATICGAMSMPLLATAKGVTWTVEMRQAKLMQEINVAQKHKELTDKEAKKLRSDLSDVARKKKKFKTESEKATGHEKLTPENNKELEEDLNEISADIKKLQLEKRTNNK